MYMPNKECCFAVDGKLERAPRGPCDMPAHVQIGETCLGTMGGCLVLSSVASGTRDGGEGQEHLTL